MLNQIVLVGRLAEKPKTINEFGIKIKILVPRSFKNEYGEYESDLITCYLWNGIADNTKKYCKKGDLIGIKGRIEQENKTMKIIAEKVTFLSNKKIDE